MELRGYMLEAEFDGETLVARGANKAAHFGLVGHGHEGDLVLPVSQIDSIDYRKPTALVNGRIDVRANGKRYQMFFRKKQVADYDRLAAALESARANA